MKYLISNQGDVYVFPVKIDHDVFWKSLKPAMALTGNDIEHPKSAGIINIALGKIKIMSGSFTLNISQTPERDKEDLETIKDYFQCF